VERLPSGTGVSDLNPAERVTGFRGFSSGLPRAEPLLAPAGYEFPTVHGPPYHSRGEMFATPFPVSLTAGVPSHPPFWKDVYRLPRRVVRHAYAIGAGTFRFTVSCLPARRFFASLRIAPHPFWFLFLRSTKQRLGFAADIAFRRSPLTRWTFALSGSGLPRPSFLGPTKRIRCSALLDFSNPFGGFAAFSAVPPSSLFFLVYQGRQDSFRVLPFSLCSGLGRPSLWVGRSFPSALDGGDLAMWVTGEVRYPSFRMFLFQGFPQAPFLLDPRAARVFHRRWLSLPLGKEPLRLSPPRFISGAGFLKRPPFTGLPAGGACLRKWSSSVPLPFVSCEAAGLSGIRFPRGVLRSPHVTFR